MKDDEILIDLVARVIREHEGSISEYDLLKACRSHSVMVAIEESCQKQLQLQLFRQNFTLMNALYQLQQQWSELGEWLDISLMSIQLKTLSVGDGLQQLSISGRESLRDYYLDWDNYYSTSADDVESLLSDFWLSFNKFDQHPQALSVLGLKGGEPRSVIEKRYRQLASQHHPDKGGCGEEFIKIREAYEILKA